MCEWVKDRVCVCARARACMRVCLLARRCMCACAGAGIRRESGLVNGPGGCVEVNTLSVRAN
jgi:hypothetical protein